MGKLFAILAVIAVAGVLLIGGGAWYWWTYHGVEFLDSGKTAMLEGAASGRALDEGGCMTRAIERHKADWNRTMASAVRNNLWLSGCLDASRVQERFCDDVPSYDNVVAAALWAASACANHGLSDSYCGNLVSNAVKYCSSPKRTEKLKPGVFPGPAIKS
jgi:hypothetical protein